MLNVCGLAELNYISIDCINISCVKLISITSRGKAHHSTETLTWAANQPHEQLQLQRQLRWRRVSSVAASSVHYSWTPTDLWNPAASGSADGLSRIFRLSGWIRRATAEFSSDWNVSAAGSSPSSSASSSATAAAE